MQKINHDIKLALSYDDVLLIPQYSEIKSRSLVDLTTQLTPHISLRLPILSSNMSTITDEGFAIALAKLGGLGVIPRFRTIEEEADMVKKVKAEGLLVGASVGVKEQAIERAEAAVKAGADILVVDVAHGHMLQVIEITKKLKQEFGKKADIVAGNVATYEGAADLFKAGADCVKVGIGPGSTCITRIETGCGVPQITAVMECARAARQHKGTLICDGGMKNSGDIVKGLAAGASAVMTGHIFAGIKETAGKIVIRDGKKYKQYNGSTSYIEKLQRAGNKVEHIEGVAGIVPYKGELEPLVNQISDNIKSGFSYVGARNLKELWEKAGFVQITSMGLRESGAHDISIY